MNIFEKIRELKFPFIALVAALSFSGLVAPANAVAPVISPVTVTSFTNAQASLTVTIQSGTPTACKAVVQLSGATAPDSLTIEMAGPPFNGAIKGMVSLSISGSTASGTLTGLTANTAYVAYAFCRTNGDASSVSSASFTTLASAPLPTATNITVSNITNSGATVAFTQSLYGSGQGCMAKLRLASSAAFTVAQVLDYTVTSLAGSSFVNSGNASATMAISGKTAGTDYVVDIACKDGSTQSSLYNAAFTTTGTPPSNNNQQQQQQVTASVRPAPAFTITNRPTVSANGQSLTLKGDNLSDVTSVKVAGKEAKISKKASGELIIDVPAGTEGYPEVELTHAGGTITMQGLIQVIKPYAQTRSLTITKFVGNRPTLAGIEALEQAYLAGTTANILTCVATVASDASAEEITKTETRAKATCQRVVNFSKYIKTADVQIKKDGATGSKPVLAVTFDRTLGGK